MGVGVIEARVLLLQAELGQARGGAGIARYHEVAAAVGPVLEAAGDAEALYKLHQNAARAYAVQADPARARSEGEHYERKGNEVGARLARELVEGSE